MLLCAASWSLAAAQSQQPQSKSPAGSAGGKAAPDHDAGSFEYYDKPEYRPGEVNASRDPGGYSAPAYADSYSLILDYVESETAAEAPNHRLGGEKSADRQDGGGTPQEAKSGTPALEGWNEKQFLSRGSSLLLHREFAPATEVFRRGVERFPESVKLEMGLGIALYARGQYDEAVVEDDLTIWAGRIDQQPFFAVFVTNEMIPPEIINAIFVSSRKSFTTQVQSN